MVTRAGSSPISSFDSLNAVAASSASPSSAFPLGNATSPQNMTTAPGNSLQSMAHAKEMRESTL